MDRLHEKTGKKYNEFGFDIDGNPEDGSVFTLGQSIIHCRFTLRLF